MRILKVVQSYYPFTERGGTAVKVRALARGLAQRGHRVTVLTADLGLRSRNNGSTDVERCQWGHRLCEDSVEAVYLPVLGHYRSLTFNPRVIDFCRQSIAEFDVLHFYGLYDLLSPIVSHFSRRYQVPYLVEPMGMYRPIDRGFVLKSIWHRTVGRALIRHAARIVATSEMERKELVDEGLPLAKVVVRHNGIDSECFDSSTPKGTFRAKFGIPSDASLILFLSRLIPRKGADLLIEAFARVCRDAEWLVIAGPDGERGYRSYLERCAAKSGVASRIVFTGPLYGEDKLSAMSDSDLFVLPSTYENFANAPAEAIACGIPVIVSDACGLQSLVLNRAGLVVKPEIGDLVGALQRLLGDRKLYEEFREACPGLAAQLRWERLSEQMEGLYVDALAFAERHSETSISAADARF